ncbi:MAG: acetoacetyl-CoA reductase [Proteobacteria bacterium]|nr:acetoacetyl-CoA reductase [Pseudomonadota bacterium]
MNTRVALVTGGTGGIGTAICRHLYQAGVRVVAGFSRGGDDSFAKDWQSLQAKEDYQFEIIYGDVADFDSCAGMVETVRAKVGPIDILVNNAGITRDATLKNMQKDQWNDVMHVNLDSVFNVTRHVITGMIERNFGRIINISSINGQKGQFGQTNYSAAKAGMHGFTKALAQEVASKHITVNTISPGYVATDMVKKVAPNILEKIIAQIPVGRLAEPIEIARVVSFLASDESGYITGANIAINGGQHMS